MSEEVDEGALDAQAHAVPLANVARALMRLEADRSLVADNADELGEDAADAYVEALTFATEIIAAETGVRIAATPEDAAEGGESDADPRGHDDTTPSPCPGCGGNRVRSLGGDGPLCLNCDR